MRPSLMTIRNIIITFRFKIVSTIENYCFDMTDATWSTDLWPRKQFTDVDVMVGPNKLSYDWQMASHVMQLYHLESTSM